MEKVTNGEHETYHTYDMFHAHRHKFKTHYKKEYFAKDKKLINCYIRSGGNISAVKDGKSIDTSMRYKPNAGIVIGTCCGEYDAKIIHNMNEIVMWTNDIDKAINKQSGFYGIKEGWCSWY